MKLVSAKPIYNRQFSAFGKDNLRWVEDTDKAGLRLVGYVRESRYTHDDYFSSDPTFGWHSDNSGHETLYPVVYQLPTRKGKQRYVYGYADPNNEGAALLCFSTCDDKNDAQHWACNLTKRAAEEARAAEEEERKQFDGIGGTDGTATGAGK